MPTSRTVTATVNALVAQYKKEIEKAAGDKTLSKTEQKKLSAFAQSHIDKLRKTSPTVTVAKAVAQLKPVIERAANAIAGNDGFIDANDVQKLRVVELRTRAAALFDPPVSGRAGVQAAIDSAEIPELVDYGRNFDMRNHRVGLTPEELFQDLAQFELDPAAGFTLADWGTVKEGADQPAAFARLLKKIGKEDTVDDEPADATKKMNAYNRVADSIAGYFNANEFTKFVTGYHEIAEDGDVESKILLAQKRDGSWVSLMYTNFPF